MSVDTYVHMYVLVCVCVRQGVHICVSVSMCRRRVGISCVLVCRRPWMLSRLQLGTAMVHVQCRKQQEQATYKLNGHTLKTSTFTLASSSMSSRAIKQAIAMCILLGCQSKQGVQGFSRFIWILNFFFRLVWFQCKVTILFTVFKLSPAPFTRTQRATAATKYSMHVLRILPPHSQEGISSKQTKWTTSAEPVTLNNKKHNRTHSEDASLVHVINGYHGRFPSFVIMSLARVWRQSLCSFCLIDAM